MLLTCEHATNRIPRAHARHFERAQRALASHRGFDLGALEVARALARHLGAPLIAGRVSRLLVDLNRSEGHPDAFSRYSRELDPEQRERVLETLHRSHRAAVRRELEALLADGARVLHVGVHSFTPVLRGIRRNADIGLLYDPARAPERAFATRWCETLHAVAPDLRVRRNYPYRGNSDGLTTTLRREHPASRYLGFELELNAAVLRGDASPGTRGGAAARRLAAIVAASLEALVGVCVSRTARDPAG